MVKSREDTEDAGEKETEDPTVYEGFIKTYDSVKKFGFIRCSALQQTYNSDIFLHHSQAGGFAVNDWVNFTVSLSSKGKPQARNLRKVEDGPTADERKRYDGQLLCNSSDTRPYGFIYEPFLYKKYGCAVYIHKRQIGDLSQGEAVSFGIRLTIGSKPQAVEVRRAPSQEARGRAGSHWWQWWPSDNPPGGAEESQIMQGVIKKTDAAKGFAFITCAELHAEYGADVFCPYKLLGGRGIGKKVGFTYTLNRNGFPQAVEVMDPPEEAPEAHEEEVPEAPRPVHHGLVKMIDAEKGFGFIKCQELFETYRADIFAAKEQLEGFQVGDPVSFCVETGRREKPKAVDLRPHDVEEAEAKEVSERVTGTVKSYDTEKGYGFLTSPDVRERFERDVFLHSSQVKQFKVGDSVSFAVRVNAQNQPQAYDLAAAPQTVDWLVPDEAAEKKMEKRMEKKVDSEEEFEGLIKSYNPNSNYGFVTCERVKELYERDCFIHGSQMSSFTVGDAIKFHVKLRRGLPTAYGVSLVRAKDADADASAAAPAAPSNPFADLDSDTLDKRLLRACASARVESLEDMRLLLEARADASGRDVTGQSALMVSALNNYHADKKCRLLIEQGADPNDRASDASDSLQTVVEWARERLNSKFAEFLVAVHRKDEDVDYTTTLDRPAGDDY